VDSLSLGFSHAILGRIRGKMKDKIFHLNRTPLTGCSTQNWFILILRELAINSKKDMGSRVPKTGEIMLQCYDFEHHLFNYTSMRIGLSLSTVGHK
jgi:hypothetical protein